MLQVGVWLQLEQAGDHTVTASVGAVERLVELNSTGEAAPSQAGLQLGWLEVNGDSSAELFTSAPKILAMWVTVPSGGFYTTKPKIIKSTCIA